jgi:predicted phosphodiesterase
MKYAIFSDVHANLPALEAFVEASDGQADGYVCLGDVVDYGPWNDECIDLIHSLPGIVYLEGNHERLFSGAESIDGKPPLARLFFETSRQYFSRDSVLRDLPNFVKIADFGAQHTIGDLRLYADTPMLEVSGKHFIGHTHYQFRRDFPGGGVLVNCGSVGQNRRRIDRVSYAIFDTSTGEVRLEERPYRLDRFIDEMRRRDYPSPCVEYYLRKQAAVA